MAIQNIKDKINKIIRNINITIINNLHKFINIFKINNSTYINNTHKINNLGVGASFSLGLLLLFVVLPLYNVTGVEDSEAITGTATDSSITFTSVKTTGCSNQGNPDSSPAAVTACVTLNPSGTSGSFATSTDSQKASFSVSTTNSQGYELTIYSTSKTTLTDGNNNELSTINTASSSTGIDSNTFNSSTYNNMWGYLPSYYNSSENSNLLYYPITTGAVTLDKTDSANSSSAKSYTISIGARADYSKPAGTYSNSNIVLAYVANPTNYSITYNKNTADAVTNMPYSDSNPQYVQSGNASATSITLSSLVPVRDGYDFKGWCSVAVNDGGSCTGTTYNLNGGGTGLAYGIDRTSSNTATLYAMWARACSTITFKTINATSIQVFTSNSLQSSNTYTNNQTACLNSGTYYIYGNFSNSYMFSSWSATAGSVLSSSSRTTTYTVNENATLTLTGRASVSTTMQDFSKSDCESLASSADYTLIDARDSNRYTVRYINGACWMTQNIRIAGGTVLTSTSSNVTSSYTIPTKDLDKTITTSDYQTYTEGRIHNSGDEIRGYWYNYCAASAGTVCSQTQANAAYDICPKGWHLASRSSSSAAGDFMGITSSTYASAFSPIYGGYYYNGSLAVTAADGDWWSATARNANGQYSLSHYNGSLNTFSSLKGYGLYVRCVRDTDPPVYMQDLTMSKLSTLLPDDGSTATVADRRDGNKYSIVKIGSLYWMQDNLKIMGTISAADSNFTGDSLNVAGGGSLTFGNTYTATRATLSTDPNYPGAYYNYCSASAETICSGSNSTEASSDICPSGWRLPTNAEFATIGTTSGNAANISALRPDYSGYYHDGTPGNTGSGGYWWSSTSFNTKLRYVLYYYSGKLYAGGSALDGQHGASIRCVKEKPKLYFQNATSADCGQDMYDSRGTDTYKSIAYSTKKIGSLCWMTRNLDLPGGTTLSSSDTNLSTGFTLPASSTSGFNSYNTDYVYNSGSTSCSSSSACYSYYAYYTATAHTNPSSEAASYDICPKGWRLPTRAEYMTLVGSYGTGSSLASNWSAVYSGYYYPGSFSSGGTNGYYWSSTANSGSDAYHLYFNSSSASISRFGKYNGFAIRCVAKS